jgi:hypothetical protein
MLMSRQRMVLARTGPSAPTPTWAVQRMRLWARAAKTAHPALKKGHGYRWLGNSSRLDAG